MAKISGFYQTLWNGYIAVYKYSKLKTLKNNSTPQYYTGPRPYKPFEKKKGFDPEILELTTSKDEVQRCILHLLRLASKG